MKYITVLFLTTALWVNNGHALGGRAPKVDIDHPLDNDYLKEVPLSEASSVNFNANFKLDFNKDGIKDRLDCRSRDLAVLIRDGKKLSRILFQWKGPAKKQLANGSKRIYTGCQVIELTQGNPSIVISTAFAHPVNGVRVRSAQFFLHNLGRRFVARRVKVLSDPSNLNSSQNVYHAASRSVKCTPYPESLINMGRTPGQLCFFAGYDSDTPSGYGTMTALLKFEQVNGKLIAKDLTASSGLLWKGGVKGTPKRTFRTYRAESGGRKIDGLHMMEGTFVDYNKDALPDLITVGQHASVRLSTMKVNKKRLEGIEFVTTNLVKAGKGNMTEFLRIVSFDEFDSRIKRPCVYISGEGFDGKYGASSRVHDHIRCYESNKWVRHDLPVKGLTSEYGAAVIKKAPNGKVYFMVDQKKQVDGKIVLAERRLFMAVK